jgi:3-hydroxybutyryl-CoA dehydrogenase
MNPVPIMKLVEIINGEKTSKETTDLIFSISKSINKIPVECNDSPGFVSNRILMPMINEAALCFEEGIATAESIDQIMMLGMSHPMGPLKLADLIGIDVCIYILNILHNDFNNSKYKPAEVLLTMKKNNKLGKKTGEGFYNYEF